MQQATCDPWSRSRRRCLGPSRAAMELHRSRRRCGGAPAGLQWSSTGVAMKLRRSRRRYLGPCRAAMELRRSCNGASPEPSTLPWTTRGLQWSSAGVAMEFCRSRQRCGGAQAGLQCSFAGAVRAALELRQGCIGAWPELQWSFAGVSVLRRSSAGATMELAEINPWCCVGAALGLQVCNCAALTRCYRGVVVIQRPPVHRSNG